MIEVLWIDDECMNSLNEFSPMGREFVEFAYDKGINITPKLTYKEGIDAIRNNPLKWCAVILDIHNQKATTGKPSDDFDEAREDIVRIQTENHQKEPYIFVLSGNKQYQTESSTIKKPSYCSKNIYDKNNGDYETLFKDIKNIENLSTLYKCQCTYADVLSNAKSFCGEQSWERMINLLYNINILEIKNDPSYLNEMRKLLEDIMDGLKQYNYPYFTTAKKVSLNSLSEYIGKDSSVPEYIRRAFHTLTRVVQDGSHRLEVDTDVLYSRAPYLLRSCLYELCNILIWMKTLV